MVAVLAPNPIGLKIGAVARRSGLPIKTIRFYSDEGLIETIGRTEGQFRLFSETVCEELALIRTLQQLGFSLAELKDVLAMRRAGVCTCADLKGSIQARLAGIDAQIDALRRVQREFSALLQDWRDCGGSTAAGGTAASPREGAA